MMRIRETQYPRKMKWPARQWPGKGEQGYVDCLCRDELHAQLGVAGFEVLEPEVRVNWKPGAQELAKAEAVAQALVNAANN